MSENEQNRHRVRAVAGLAVILAVLVGFLYRLVAGEPLQFWLAGLVTVLGLAAGASVFGTEAMKVGASLFDASRRR